jgi:hypothetical protein
MESTYAVVVFFLCFDKRMVDCCDSSAMYFLGEMAQYVRDFVRSFFFFFSSWFLF